MPSSSIAGTEKDPYSLPASSHCPSTTRFLLTASGVWKTKARSHSASLRLSSSFHSLESSLASLPPLTYLALCLCSHHPSSSLPLFTPATLLFPACSFFGDFALWWVLCSKYLLSSRSLHGWLFLTSERSILVSPLPRSLPDHPIRAAAPCPQAHTALSHNHTWPLCTTCSYLRVSAVFLYIRAHCLLSPS